MAAILSDQDARERIIEKFYEGYLAGGLLAFVNYEEVCATLKLDDSQGQRCFDYLTVRGLIRPVSAGGVFVPTADLVDHVESRQESQKP